MFKKVISAAAIIAVTVVLFKAGQALAFKERGYVAYGGEYLLLLFPLFIYIGKEAVKDIISTWAELNDDNERGCE